ncbi:uncharacterized protein [Euphorbia lathyris]|uniref:uncharacterized protein n=1 Tax=Euphorbia lathyris TaxID=212925 RepID=UPI0033132C81
MEFDKDHSWFAKDCRNVRLGLASDGFNPFGNMSTNYSMWPVVLVVYNLPPWKCMKEAFFILAMLIPGKTSPGNDIDVYLQPLIDELKELWEVGIETYDAFTCEKFRLHAALLWTINDFPAYAMLSGWSTKGKLACPVCNKDTSSLTLKHGGKQCYLNHRKYLDQNDTLRRSRKFNGKPEHLPKPKELSGDDILEQLRHIPEDFKFGKPPNTRKRKRDSNHLNWTKKSIFFELPYWKSLKLRHNLDVMHIEKNICEHILGTLLNIVGKTKDNDKARLDLAEMGIRKELHLQRHGEKLLMPQACYTLTTVERKKFCQWLKAVKFPDGYASNLTRCVNLDNGKVSGTKSHDYHVFLQRLLPIAANGFLNKDLYHVLFGLSHFFKELCAKALDKSVLNRLHKDIVLILCKLELIYPPSFFVIMVHLAIHLSHEVELGGHVHYPWMYPFERFLRTLKDFVKNKAQPEGSIAEAYIAKECLTFCSLYLRGVETKFNQEERNYDGDQVHDVGGFFVFTPSARPLGASKCTMLSQMEFDKIQWYILNNSAEIDDYLSLHKEELTRENPLNVEKRHEAEFASWFKDRVTSLHRNGSLGPKDDLYVLGLGPGRRVSKYSGIIVKGIRFHTLERNQHRSTQNNGVMVEGEQNSKDVNFYGILQEIIELDYLYGKRVYMFKCDWWDVSDNRNGIRDDGKLVSVNIGRKWYADQPFILASQAEQVFYIDDIKNGSN